jgi:hypothetical protein
MCTQQPVAVEDWWVGHQEGGDYDGSPMLQVNCAGSGPFGSVGPFDGSPDTALLYFSPGQALDMAEALRTLAIEAS